MVRVKKKIAKSRGKRALNPIAQTNMIFLKMTNFDEYMKSERDPLNFLFKISVALYDYKVVRLIYQLIFIQYTYATIMAIHKIITSFDKDVFLKYGPFVGCQSFILINIGTIFSTYIKGITILKYVRRMFFPIDATSEAVSRLIFIQCFYLKLMCIINLTCSCVAATAFSFSTDYLSGKAYVMFFVKEHFPGYSKYYNIWISFTIWPSALVMISLAHILAYVGFNGVFQLKLINEAIKTLCASKLKAEERYHSTVYQEILKQKMKIIIMYHSLIVRNVEKAQSFLFLPILATSLGSVILGASIMLEIAYAFSFKSDVTQNYVGLIFCSVAGIITALLYVFSGQLFKDEAEEMYYQLIQLPWYYMDKDNRNLYLILLMATLKPISLSADIVEINFLLALRISKGLYSMLCLIVNFM